MKLTFIGAGEAFSPDRTNSSYLIENDEGITVMVDCGYTSPFSLQRLLQEDERKNLLNIPDSLLITHLHGDHIAGIPALIVPMLDEMVETGYSKGRELEIVSVNPNVKEKVLNRLDDDYPGVLEKMNNMSLNLRFRTLNEKNDYLQGFRLRFAPTLHSVQNYATRFEYDDKIFAISGDGKMTPGTEGLYHGVNLLIHEGYRVSKNEACHSSIEEVVNFATQTDPRISRVAIVHVKESERKNITRINQLVDSAIAQKVKLWLPKDHEYVEF